LTLKIVGSCDEPAIEEYLQSEVAKHHLSHRVEMLGRVDVPTLLSLYADCFAVYYAPFDEDYGFVTLEALTSGKPVVTAQDSGSVLDYISDAENGLVVSPDERSVAKAFNSLLKEDGLYERLAAACSAGKSSNDWANIIDKLTS
jgi:glycosyltransferase involved in cell wall biosynthesis